MRELIDMDRELEVHEEALRDLQQKVATGEQIVSLEAFSEGKCAEY